VFFLLEYVDVIIFIFKCILHSFIHFTSEHKPVNNNPYLSNITRYNGTDVLWWRVQKVKRMYNVVEVNSAKSMFLNNFKVSDRHSEHLLHTF